MKEQMTNKKESQRKNMGSRYRKTEPLNLPVPGIINNIEQLVQYRCTERIKRINNCKMLLSLYPYTYSSYNIKIKLETHGTGRPT
jgi:hypothetical protein